MFTYKPVVYLVDDDPSVLKALPRALRHHGLEVDAFASAKEFLGSYVDKPGCLVLDLSMPDMTGLELQRELARLKIEIPIIFITGHGGVPESVQALKAGAIDFLEKPFLPKVLLHRIEEAIEQDVKNRARTKNRQEIRDRFSRLTERENEVLLLLLGNNPTPSSKEMGRTLGISHRTIEHHRSRVLEKTQAGSVPELQVLAKNAEVGPAPNH